MPRIELAVVACFIFSFFLIFFSFQHYYLPLASNVLFAVVRKQYAIGAPYTRWHCICICICLWWMYVICREHINLKHSNGTIRHQGFIMKYPFLAFIFRLISTCKLNMQTIAWPIRSMVMKIIVHHGLYCRWIFSHLPYRSLSRSVSLIRPFSVLFQQYWYYHVAHSNFFIQYPI